MFTMRICNADALLVAQGDSRPQEEWSETFVRLLRSSLPPGPWLRQVIHARIADGQAGEANTVVVTSFRDGTGNVHCDLPLIVHTDPPQP